MRIIDMHDLKYEKKSKVTMDADVFSLFGRHGDKIPITEKDGLRPIGTSNLTRPICYKEREALETIFNNRTNFQLIGLPSIPKQETMHLSGAVRNMKDFECSKYKIEELNNYLEDDEMSQLLAEAEDATIDIILTCSPKLLEIRIELRDKGVVNVEIMRPSEYVRNYLS
jgi:hypothetical protein